LFLDTAERLYPDFRTSLQELLPRFSPSPEGFVFDWWVDGELAEWCRRWNLLGQDGHPVEWALKMAYESLENFRWGAQYNAPFIWFIGSGGLVPHSPENTTINFRPHSETLEAAKNPMQNARRLHSELSEHLKGYLNSWQADMAEETTRRKELGKDTKDIEKEPWTRWIKTPRKHSILHFEWAAHHIAGGKTFGEIADLYPAEVDREDLAEQVSSRINEIRSLMGWSRPHGGLRWSGPSW
jgi:hypothetical protein